MHYRAEFTHRAMLMRRVMGYDWVGWWGGVTEYAGRRRGEIEDTVVFNVQGKPHPVSPSGIMVELVNRISVFLLRVGRKK